MSDSDLHVRTSDLHVASCIAPVFGPLESLSDFSL
jgi:hypothetical protein